MKRAAWRDEPKGKRKGAKTPKNARRVKRKLKQYSK